MDSIHRAHGRLSRLDRNGFQRLFLQHHAAFILAELLFRRAFVDSLITFRLHLYITRHCCLINGNCIELPGQYFVDSIVICDGASAALAPRLLLILVSRPAPLLFLSFIRAGLGRHYDSL